MATIAISILVGCWIIFVGFRAVSVFGQKAMAEQKSFLSSLIYRIPLTLGGNWSSEVALKQGHELVKTGPYRFVRHPIYTGLLLMCLGTAIVPGQLRSWLGFLLLCAGFWIKLKQEETLMLQHFPDEYPVYRRQVKVLIPFII